MSSDATQQLRGVIVEDDPASAKIVEIVLRGENFTVDICSTGEAGLDKCKETNPDVVILDFELPGINGQQVCRTLRTFSDAYVVMLTARDAEADRVMTLLHGADDYLIKPFSPAELAARVQSMLRRPRKIGAEPAPTKATEEQTQFGELEFDRRSRMVLLRGTKLGFTELEYNILTVLAASAPDPVSRAELISKCWNADWSADDHVLGVHVHNIRKKLRDADVKIAQIQTVRGVGYRAFTTQ